MKTKRTKKLTTQLATPIRKAGCALFASCILLSSCGQSAQNTQGLPQDLTQDAQNPTAIPEATESFVLTVTPEPTTTPEPTPEPTPTSTPIPTPASTPEPTPMPEFTALLQPYPVTPDNASWLNYMTQEEIDATFALSYDHYNDQMQLYARYQGRLLYQQYYHHAYCIDLIQRESSCSSMLINIKIYSGSGKSSFVKDGDSVLLQNMYYYSGLTSDVNAVTEVLQIMDINHDGNDDFILELGKNVRNWYSLAFVYDMESDSYVFLDEFCCATYMPEHQTICEESNSSMGTPFQKCKYFVAGTRAILTEAIEYIPGECESYTYQNLIDGELVTVLENGAYEELCEFIGDFNTWRTAPAILE